jgi:fructosamine-3-kinase
MAKESFLVLEYIESVNQAKYTQEIEAAKLLTTLHTVTNESRMYGYYYDTTIGPFPQKNEQTQYNWTLFLGQMRIMPMARICYDEGRTLGGTVSRLV